MMSSPPFLLVDRAPAVRLAAALAIVRYDRRDSVAERVLLEELARMDARTYPVRPFTVLAKGLQADDDEVRAAAAEVLGELGVKAVPLLGQLESVRTKDAQLWVRSVAAKAYDTVHLFVP